MNANEAKKLTDEWLIEITNKEYNMVIDEIKAKIQKGAYCLNLYKPLQPSTIEVLKKNGYTVKRSTDYEAGIYYTISWNV